MPRQLETPVAAGGSFRLGEWLVEPSLNRLSNGDTTIQLELKVMDVLVCLAERAGEVVTRQEIVDRVWATEFISDNTLTHAITEIRNALGDDARNPSFIETIHRRGYRLIASVESAVSDEAVVSKVARFPSPERPMEAEADRGPYPGLAAFTEADAEFFFGREAEVAQMWRKLTSRRLLAVIGPSGVGKSSFLRAGVIPARPDGWSILVCQPGEAPFAALARALVPEFSGDDRAMEEIVGVRDGASALTAVSRWRHRYDEALLIVDQFEELFTLNSQETQARFAEMLRKVVDEAGVHVLLSVRDDFLFHVHDYPALAPILDELTLLGAPSPDSLHLALVEPARRLDFTFESDDLPDEMIAEVEGERGALPLLAFAISRLWEKRDREQKLLTRQTYADIGGVGGALARHAEATIDRIGTDRIAVARELFRNLVTAEGTRAVREWNELLSIFSDSQSESAEEVLRQLIDARLLTSYEVRTDAENPTRSVEVVHESLLSSWPRLVRWQTQDADAAQLRDQLRQAARTWDEHDRTRDFLWTGRAYREFALWKGTYPGGLTAVEEGFASAMTKHNKRRKRRRRVVAAAALLLAVVVATATTVLWRQSLREANRAEAAELVALGQLELESYPTASVAHAIASLELSDSRAARLLALEALWKGPTAFVVNEKATLGSIFTSDGHWLIQSFSGSGDGPLRVIGEDGSTGYLIGTDGHERVFPARTGTETDLFGLLHWEKHPSGKAVYKRITLWSASEKRMLGELKLGNQGFTRPGFAMDSTRRRLVVLLSEGDGQFSVDVLSDDGTAKRLGTHEFDGGGGEDSWILRLDWRNGRQVVASNGHDIYAIDVGDDDLSKARFLGRQRNVISRLSVDPLGHFVATSDEEGRIRLWDLIGTSPTRTLDGPPEGWPYFADDGTYFTSRTSPADGQMEFWLWSLEAEDPVFLRRVLLEEPAPMSTTPFDPVGRQLVRTGFDLKIRLWRLSAPADADPLFLLRGEVVQVYRAEFHPQGRWLVGADEAGIAFWPLSRPYPSVIRHHDEAVWRVVFGPRGRWIASSSADGTVRLWPVDGGVPQPGRVLFDDPKTYQVGLASSPGGDRILAAGGDTRGGGQVLVLSLEGQPPRTLARTGSQSFGAAISRDGRMAAAASADWQPNLRYIKVWDLASEEQITVLAEGQSSSYANPRFVEGGDLMALDQSGLRRWNIETGESELLYGGSIQKYAATADGRMALLVEAPTEHDPGQAIYLDLETGDTTPLEAHGDRVWAVGLDASGRIAVTADVDGVVRVGAISGEEPHLLFGHENRVMSVAIDPLGRWIASGSQDNTVRLWPMPDLSKPPLHTLPHDELIAKLKTLTNLRVVRDEESSTGWKLQVGPFPGWETVPTW